VEIDAFRRVSFSAQLLRTLRLTASFGGRSTRAELAIAFTAAIFFVPIGKLTLTLANVPAGAWIVLGLHLASAVPLPALVVRRLHDQDRRGWWMLLTAFGFGLWLARAVIAATHGVEARIALDRIIWPLDWIAVAANVVAVILLVMPGTRGSNRFGTNPRELIQT